MIKNYYLIAWRNLLKNKLYSAINIGMGLWVGNNSDGKFANLKVNFLD